MKRERITAGYSRGMGVVRGLFPGWVIGPVLAFAFLAVLVGLMDVLDPQKAQADEAKFYLDCPTTEVREGENVDVFLVRVTDHQHDAHFGASWHTDAGTAGTNDYVHQETEFIRSSQAERLANRLSRTVETQDDGLVEGNETFTIRFSPVDNVVDRDDPDRDEKYEITIIDDLSITGIEISSTPAEGDTYGIGETMEFEVTLSAEAEVEGVVVMGTYVGDQ